MQPWPNAGASACAVAAANATMDDSNFLASTIAKNNEVKKMMYNFYKANNIPYIESYANFVYYSMNAYKVDFSKELETRKILCGGINEEKGKWYRVTVGTENEMKQYMKAVVEIINK
jgi:histidinol-phosphate aminotransferase